MGRIWLFSIVLRFRIQEGVFLFYFLLTHTLTGGLCEDQLVLICHSLTFKEKVFHQINFKAKGLPRDHPPKWDLKLRKNLRFTIN